MDGLKEGNFKTPTMPPSFLKPKPKTMNLPPPEEKCKTEGEIVEIAQKSILISDKNEAIEAPSLDYIPPPWACEPEPGLHYQLEVLKNGTVVNIEDFEKRKHNPTFVLIGRLPNCDIVMEHPSISRYHCILQYGDDKMDKKGKGWFIYDMGSTHGTKMNKNRLPPKQFIRMQVGFVFQFGSSTRICNLLGPSEDAEAEWDLSPTEMREKMKKKALEAKLAAQARKEYVEEKELEEEEDEGINWGMDYGDENGSSMFDPDDPDADGEAYYNEDPKKALSKFFERIGDEMNFTYVESGAGSTHKWTCSIELPIEIEGVDRTFTAQAIVSTSKKDATVQCALEACRLLDKHGALRGGSTRVRMKKQALEENDFYEEDDDLFYDRTGQLELQRDKRKQWTLKAMGKATEEKDTYETLNVKLKATREEMAEIQRELDELGKNKSMGQAADVDDYVNQLAKGKITVKDDMQTKIHKSTLRQKLVTLTHEAQTLEKLVKITKPLVFTDPKAPPPSSESASKQAFLRKMMKFGNVRKELNNVEAKVAAEQALSTEKVPEKKDNLEKVTEQASVKELIKEPVQARQLAVRSSDFPSTSADPIPTKKEAKTVIEDVPTTSTEPVKTDDTKNTEITDVSESEDRKRSIETEEFEPVIVPKKKKQHIRKEKWAEYGAGCENKDEQYATWMPPENQSGDGKTALHAKFAGRY